MTAALEQFLSNPVFADAISSKEVGFVWQHAKKIDRFGELLATPFGGTLQNSAHSGIMKEILEGIPRCEQLMQNVQRIIQKLEPYS